VGAAIRIPWKRRHLEGDDSISSALWELTMKTLLKVIGAILACLVLVLVILRFTGFGPHGGTPGLWIKGKLVTTPVADWSFTDKYPTIELQTGTWYLLPHSVTINCISYNGQLYLVSAYPPTTRHDWNDYVMRDPHVRLKIGDQLYDRTVSLVTDPTVKAGVLQARRTKYPRLRVLPNWTVFIFHVVG
jgi:hypothetical protein